MLEVTENPGFGELPPHYAVLAITAGAALGQAGDFQARGRCAARL